MSDIYCIIRYLYILAIEITGTSVTDSTKIQFSGYEHLSQNNNSLKMEHQAQSYGVLHNVLLQALVFLFLYQIVSYQEYIQAP
jgi:cytochrome b561